MLKIIRSDLYFRFHCFLIFWCFDRLVAVPCFTLTNLTQTCPGLVGVSLPFQKSLLDFPFSYSDTLSFDQYFTNALTRRFNSSPCDATVVSPSLSTATLPTSLTQLLRYQQSLLCGKIGLNAQKSCTRVNTTPTSSLCQNICQSAVKSEQSLISAWCVGSSRNIWPMTTTDTKFCASLPQTEHCFGPQGLDEVQCGFTSLVDATAFCRIHPTRKCCEFLLQSSSMTSTMPIYSTISGQISSLTSTPTLASPPAANGDYLDQHFSQKSYGILLFVAVGCIWTAMVFIAFWFWRRNCVPREIKQNAENFDITRITSLNISSASTLSRIPEHINFIGTITQVIYDYAIQLPDELDLGIGDSVFTENVYDDGWGFGKNLRTGQTGVYPIACLNLNLLGKCLSTRVVTEEP